MFSKNKKQNQSDVSRTKPVYPAYVPSSVNVQNKKTEDEQKNSQEMYECNQIYVTNLPTKTNMHEMGKLFPECISIALDVNDNSSESHAAYVEFNDAQATERACLKARGSSLRGNTLIIAPKLKYN